MSDITVILPTYRPNISNLTRVLDGLKAQTLTEDAWELILVCSATPPESIESQISLDWKENKKVISETEPGLTRARIAGIRSASSPLIVFVDDDNVLQDDYLEQVKKLFEVYPDVAAFGGKSLPLYEEDPPLWMSEYQSLLALRDLGNEIMTSQIKGKIVRYPEYAPIGAGMSLRLVQALSYVHSRDVSSNHDIPDRTEESLSSGGDNDIVLHCLQEGKEVGYAPELVLHHLISKARLTTEYLAKVNYASSRSWVKVLAKYNICPWKKIHPLMALPRKILAYLRYSAFSNTKGYIDWCGACGSFDGRGDL